MYITFSQNKIPGTIVEVNKIKACRLKKIFLSALVVVSIICDTSLQRSREKGWAYCDKNVKRQSNVKQISMMIPEDSMHKLKNDFYM